MVIQNPISTDGSVRELIKGDVLLPGEKMVTGPDAMALYPRGAPLDPRLQ